MAKRADDALSRGLGVLRAGLAGPPLLAPKRLGQALAAGKGTKQRAVLMTVGAASAIVAGIAGRDIYAAITRTINGGRSREITKALTINRLPADVKGLWQQWLADHPQLRELGENLMADFSLAPGDRGTELVVRVTTSKVAADHALDDTLRRFKQVVETGEVVRSDGAPDGKHAFGQFPQHPARPLTTEELAEAGA